VRAFCDGVVPFVAKFIDRGADGEFPVNAQNRNLTRSTYLRGHRLQQYSFAVHPPSDE
jgi:hypothetical protein